ncbi:MAG: carboxyl transferase domain-containing protein, partial [Chloroflexota bacterium]
SQADDPEAERASLEAEYSERYLTPYAAANAGYIDDVIEPADTRARLIDALYAIKDKYIPTTARKHGNMPV